MVAVGGFGAVQGGGDFAARAIKGLVSGNAGNILVIVFGVIELLVGVFMILKIVIGDRFGSFGTVLALIAIVVWIVAIVLSDILGASRILNGGSKNFLEWLYYSWRDFSSKISLKSKSKKPGKNAGYFYFLILAKSFLKSPTFPNPSQ